MYEISTYNKPYKQLRAILDEIPYNLRHLYSRLAASYRITITPESSKYSIGNCFVDVNRDQNVKSERQKKNRPKLERNALNCELHHN